MIAGFHHTIVIVVILIMCARTHDYRYDLMNLQGLNDITASPGLSIAMLML